VKTGYCPFSKEIVCQNFKWKRNFTNKLYYSDLQGMICEKGFWKVITSFYSRII
jgi:hypothetical protein